MQYLYLWLVRLGWHPNYTRLWSVHPIVKHYERRRAYEVSRLEKRRRAVERVSITLTTPIQYR